MTNAPAPPPALVASAEGELPADIVKAIDKFEAAAWDHGFGRRMQSSDPASRAVLNATILARLTAAEAELLPWARAADDNRRHAQAALARAERAEKDAARFQALMRCGRIKPQGSAGVDTKTGERTYPDEPGSVHFGAEFWVQPEEKPSNLTIWGRHCLSALADDILAYEAAALAQPAPAEET